MADAVLRGQTHAHSVSKKSVRDALRALAPLPWPARADGPFSAAGTGPFTSLCTARSASHKSRTSPSATSAGSVMPKPCTHDRRAMASARRNKGVNTGPVPSGMRGCASWIFFSISEPTICDSCAVKSSADRSCATTVRPLWHTVVVRTCSARDMHARTAGRSQKPRGI